MMNVRARARAAAVGDDAALAATPTPGLKPAMASRKLHVLGYVREYIAACNGSPSLSEIAAGVGVGKSRARDLVDVLVKEGKLCRKDGTRGLLLPCKIDEAKRLLREAGCMVDEDFDPPPLTLGPRTKTALPDIPVLEYVPAGISGGTDIDGKGNGADSQAA